MWIHKSFSRIVQASIIASTFCGGLAFITAPVAMAAPQNPSTVAATNSYADIVDRATPAVVTIRSGKRVRAAQQFPFSDDPFFRQFFENGNRNRQRDEQSLVEHALGSGVIVSPDGYILTNHPLCANIDETESEAIITEQGGQENHRERDQECDSFCSQLSGFGSAGQSAAA